MKFALTLLSLAVVALSGCKTNTVVTQRSLYSPTRAHGAWTKTYHDGDLEVAKEEQRPLWKENEHWKEYPGQ